MGAGLPSLMRPAPLMLEKSVHLLQRTILIQPVGRYTSAHKICHIQILSRRIHGNMAGICSPGRQRIQQTQAVPVDPKSGNRTASMPLIFF